jgi:hypothetical protein
MAIQPQPCARCQELIPVERLRLVPKTRLCVKCSQEVGGEYTMVVSRVRTSKTGSLKRNYGDVEVARVPKRIPPREE